MPNGRAENSSGGNGHSTAAEAIYALSDEQLLNINEDGDLDDASIAPNSAGASSAPIDETRPTQHGEQDSDGHASLMASIQPSRVGTEQVSANRADQASQDSINETGTGQASETAALQTPPEWLVQAMADPQRGGEARQFWESAQAAQRDSAAYREMFPTPDAARDAASRAEQLTSLDRAYFGAAGLAPQQLSASREALAQQLFRDDPAAFREMLAAGLRVVGVKNIAGVVPPIPRPVAEGSGVGNSVSARETAPENAQRNSATRFANESDVTRNETLQQYATFERTTNDELDRAMRPEIARILERALPAGCSNDAGRATQERLAGMVRNEIEIALKQDRALGEQVAQVLRGGASPGKDGSKALRFDDSTRAQVVRLIAARAASLVPSASRRVLGEWTQSALSAHRERSSRQGVTSARVNLSPSSAAPSSRHNSKREAVGTTASPSATTLAQHPTSTRPARNNARNNARENTRHSGINYRALTDEDILNL